jgi:hypothetical protein
VRQVVLLLLAMFDSAMAPKAWAAAARTVLAAAAAALRLGGIRAGGADYFRIRDSGDGYEAAVGSPSHRYCVPCVHYVPFRISNLFFQLVVRCRTRGRCRR